MKSKRTKANQPRRQGDVLLIPITASVDMARLTTVPRKGGRVVLAEGETTGHYHAIADDGVVLLSLEERAEMGRVARQLLEECGYKTEIRDEEIIGLVHVSGDSEPAALVHDEHGPIPLMPGRAFIALRQVEHIRGEIRQVAD